MSKMYSMLLMSLFLTVSFPFGASAQDSGEIESDNGTEWMLPDCDQCRELNGEVYLNTEKIEKAPAEADLLLRTISGKLQPKGAVVTAWLEAYHQHPSIEKLYQDSQQKMFELMGFENKEDTQDLVSFTMGLGAAWTYKFPAFYKGIINYVGTSGEGEEGGEVDGSGCPNWLDLNKQLRNLKPGQSMTGAPAQCLNEIESSLKVTPKILGLVFRGKPLTRKEFDERRVNMPWDQKAFTSTSLSPEVAKRFGTPQDQASQQRGIIILRLKKAGASVSPLTMDPGMGSLGRMDEFEVLLSPGAILDIKYKVEDTKNKIFYIFGEYSQ